MGNTECSSFEDLPIILTVYPVKHAGLGRATLQNRGTFFGSFKLGGPEE